jgi:hypothetical protein
MKFSLYWKHNLIVSCTNRDTSNQDFSILTLTTKLIYGRAVGKVWSKGYANKKLLDPKFRPFLREVVIPKHYNLGHSKDLGVLKVAFSENPIYFSNLGNKYSKSLSWAKLFTVMGGKLKYISSLEECFGLTFWRFDKQITLSEKKLPLTKSIFWADSWAKK